MYPNTYTDPNIPSDFPEAIRLLGEGGAYVARFTPGDEYGPAATPARIAKSKLKGCTLIRVGGISNHYWHPGVGAWLDYRGKPCDVRPPAGA